MLLTGPDQGTDEEGQEEMKEDEQKEEEMEERGAGTTVRVQVWVGNRFLLRMDFKMSC